MSEFSSIINIFMLDTFLCAPLNFKLINERNIQFILPIWLMEFGKKDSKMNFIYLKC